MNLDDVRVKIDHIDEQMRTLFLERMRLSEEVAEIKLKTKDSIRKPEREQALIKRLSESVAEDLTEEYRSFLKKLLEVSRHYQYRLVERSDPRFRIPLTKESLTVKRVAYQGLPASYSHLSAKILYPEKSYIAKETFEDVFDAVLKEEADVGIVPLENSTAGSVNEVYDLLLAYDLYICGDCVKKVDHCLAAVPGTSLTDIQMAYSHPQALSQCSAFLKRCGILPVEERNTAMAAKRVAKEKSRFLGAICSKEAAEEYHLTVLKESINNGVENATRFVAISKGLHVEPEHNRLSLVFTCPHESGSLADALTMFSDFSINLSEIHSRPDLKNPWHYFFYVDCEVNLMDDRARALLFQLTSELPSMRILGSYHKSDGSQRRTL